MQGIRSHGVGVTGGFEQPSMGSGTKSVLEEQQTLLILELSLQSPIEFSYNVLLLL